MNKQTCKIWGKKRITGTFIRIIAFSFLLCMLIGCSNVGNIGLAKKIQIISYEPQDYNEYAYGYNLKKEGNGKDCWFICYTDGGNTIYKQSSFSPAVWDEVVSLITKTNLKEYEGTLRESFSFIIM